LKIHNQLFETITGKGECKIVQQTLSLHHIIAQEKGAAANAQLAAATPKQVCASFGKDYLEID
jgi:hypothetical protein